MNATEAITTLGVVVGALAVLWIVWRLVKSRVPDRLADVVSQLIPVTMLIVLLVTGLIIIDPDQGDRLLESTLAYLPQAFVAVVVVIVARALGRLVGVVTETALERVSPVVAARSKLAVSSVILGVGIIIALQQLGISTDIVLLLVGGLVLATAVAVALLVGLGGLPLAQQVAAGRHVQERYDVGEVIRVLEHEGRITSIGLSTTRIEALDGGVVDLPNRTLLDNPVIKFS